MDSPPVPGLEALARLRAGNRRFVADMPSSRPLGGRALRERLVAGQRPLAIVLGCSDSRVPAEIVFDQGLGDLFVIRVAGNVVAPSLVGSVEFAAERFGTRLVVVVGHTDCGAIAATLDAISGETTQSKNLASIVDRIRPAVAPLVADPGQGGRKALERRAMSANVRASAAQLRHASPILEGLIEKEGLLVVAAEYDLETGIVDFLDAPA